jgi:predicted dehydrogenase
VDALLILSLCGAAHLEHARLFLQHRIPLFIDKPFTNSLSDALEIQRLSQEYQTLVWHASGMRFSDDVLALKNRLSVVGQVQGLVSHGPGWLHEGNPGLLHYGIHSIEQAYSLMGPGCLQVSCQSTPLGDTVTGLWGDGRQVTVRTLRTGSTAYGLLTFHSRGILHTPTSTRNSYRNLCQLIAQGFITGTPPVPLEESVEVIRFILAARQSSLSGGQPVSLKDLPHS